MATTTTTTDDNTYSYELRIPLLDHEKKTALLLYPSSSTSSSSSPSTIIIPPTTLIESFQQDGFVVLPNVFSSDAVNALNDRLEEILRGHYDRGQTPDKTPRLLKGPWKKNAIHNNNNNTTDQESIDDAVLSSSSSSLPLEGSDNQNNGGKKKKKKQTPNSKPPVDGAAAPLGFSGNVHNVKVLQVINVHKADHLFHTLATSWQLGCLVAHLAGWLQHGTRLGQDQIWAKPPGSPPLVFHRDSPYFMFDPPDVVTVWVALDDMDAALGPLEYVRGSHLWGGNGRVGSAHQFFQQQQQSSLLYAAAQREGLRQDEIEVVSMAGLAKGGISIHHGRTWHGSGKNTSRHRPRRGLGLHFIPAQARFTADAMHSRLWRRYVQVDNKEKRSDDDDNDNDDGGDKKVDVSQILLPDEDFPITWAPSDR